MSSAQRPAAPDPSTQPAAGGSTQPAAGGSTPERAPRPVVSRPPQLGIPAQQPVALLYGRGRLIVHGNPAFIAEFGAGVVGLPASEALPDWPRRVFEAIDRAFEAGRPVAAWVQIGGARRRLTIAPRADVESGEIYGVAIRLATEEGASGAT
jgi:hypothetical protein